MSSDHPTYRTCGTQGCEYPARYCIDHAHAIGKQAERRIVEWLRGLDGKRDFGRPSNVADAEPVQATEFPVSEKQNEATEPTYVPPRIVNRASANSDVLDQTTNLADPDKGTGFLSEHPGIGWWIDGFDGRVNLDVPSDGDARTPGSCPGHEIELTIGDLRAMLEAMGG